MPHSLRPESGPRRLRTVLICHAESRLNRESVARWLASFTELVGLVIIEETGVQTRARIRREVRRSGWLRFLDVLAFRLYYGLFLQSADARWLDARLDEVARRFGPLPPSTRELRTPDPNTPEVAAFLRELQPDFAVARCKRLLKESIFAAPTLGTFVLHPGICPEYRNAHGAFWALAQNDLENVGLTLLRIDRGVDTGPVYGYFRCALDELQESHIVLMTRLVLDNFDAIRDRLLDVASGTARPIDTTGRPSGVWGQPWLSKYLAWKRAARRRRHARAVA